MNPDLLLRVLAALAGYLLKTTFAFGLCLLCSRLAHSPKQRLVVWLGFLFGAAGYWLWLVRDVFASGPPAANVFPGILPSAAAAVGAWHLRSSWALPLALTMRAAGIVYLTVLLYRICAHLKKWWRLQWVMKFATSAPAAVEERFRTLAHGVGVGRARLLVLSGVSSPATFGWIRRTVLLPDVCLQQDSPDLDDILLHELHHVRRWDFVWSQLAMACESLVFFQPAGWYALRQVNLERELACDLAVVTKDPERRATYAECLIRFARLRAAHQENAWGVDFAASQHLTVRIHSILAGSRKIPVWSICFRTASMMALLAGFVAAVPSLAVLLAYTRQVAQPSSRELIEAPPVIKAKASTALHRQSTSSPLSRGTLGVAVSSESGQLALSGEDAADSRVVGEAVTSGSSRPQLLHRPLAGAPAGDASQQTIALVDPDGTQGDSKAADRKQAVEQTATTALGVYRRLGAVDRH